MVNPTSYRCGGEIHYWREGTAWQEANKPVWVGGEYLKACTGQVRVGKAMGEAKRVARSEWAGASALLVFES